MAILHRATIRPTKAEVLTTVVGGEVEVLGAYRFDDPAGEVGVEGFLLRAADDAPDAAVRHVVLTYRAAPLEGAEPVATMEHSVLGSRWIHLGGDDLVALECFARALAGEQQQAAEEIWDGEELVQTREPSVRIERVVGARGGDAPTLLDEVADDAHGREHLRVTWADRSGVVVTA